MKPRYSQQLKSTSQPIVKSILKHKQSDDNSSQDRQSVERPSKKHNFMSSASHSEQKPKGPSSKLLRFVDNGAAQTAVDGITSKEAYSNASDFEELER